MQTNCLAQFPFSGDQFDEVEIAQPLISSSCHIFQDRANWGNENYFLSWLLLFFECIHHFWFSRTVLIFADPHSIPIASVV